MRNTNVGFHPLAVALERRRNRFKSGDRNNLQAKRAEKIFELMYAVS